MKTENLTKEQAIDFLTEYAKWGIHLNYPSNPEKSLNKMEECIAVLTASGSVAAPKEPKEKEEKLPADPYLAALQLDNETRALRDQLREKNELIKEMAAGLIKAKKYVSEGADMFESAIDAQHTKQEFQNVAKSLDSLIKKSRKL